MKKQVSSNSRSGAILGMVLVIMLAICVVGVSLLHLGMVNGIEMSRTINGGQAFWSAEAGMQQARALFRGNLAFTNSVFPYPFASTDFGYVGQIIDRDGWRTNFRVISTGLWQNAIGIVQHDIKVEPSLPEAFDYAIYAGDTMELRQGTSITGDVFAADGYSFVGGAPTVEGGAIYDNDTSSSYPPPDPVPPVPILDTSPYEAQIVNAATFGVTTNLGYPLNLSILKTNYVKKMNFDVGGRIDGPGVLVVSGNVNIPNTLLPEIGHNVTIISGGTFTIDKSFISGSNSVFYASDGFDLANDDNISFGSCIILTPGDINIKYGLNFSGLMYAGGNIDADKEGTLVGSMIAVGSIRLKKEYDVTYDASLLPPIPFPGFTPIARIIDYVWVENFIQ